MTVSLFSHCRNFDENVKILEKSSVWNWNNMKMRKIMLLLGSIQLLARDECVNMAVIYSNNIIRMMVS